MTELAPRPPTLLLGARSFVRGARWIARHPRHWPHAIVPALLAVVLVTTFASLGGWAAWRLSAPLRGDASLLWQVLGVLEAIAAGGVAVGVGALLGLSLAQPASGWALDHLSRSLDLSLGGVDRPDGGWFETAWRGLRVTLAGLLVSLPVLGALLLVGVVFPPAIVVTVPLKLMVGALVVAWDLLDYPFGLRGMRVRERLRFIRANFSAVLGFGACASLVLLIPGVGLLVLLPLGVAGATQLVAEVERGPSLPPPVKPR
ncbi:MAG: EI24 domain-containing protein [Deltaproteobacteria bacterium]|nr:EI24 domain-containing protein [Myxococcales bacterium]MDP3212941.1 EI24 domain-containing protein [Deltaproteobacteria bacterium]